MRFPVTIICRCGKRFDGNVILEFDGELRSHSLIACEGHRITCMLPGYFRCPPAAYELPQRNVTPGAP